MKTSLYCEQKELWPKSGQHILAQYNEHSIIVYQAYRPSIAHYAIEHQKFGGDFKYTRMSWIKPNFLWMMYRSGWATKEGQEHILAIEIPRSLFDKFLLTAIASTWNLHQFPTQEKWKAALSSSEVRLQWDPDHSPNGASLERRAIQIGLRGKMLEQFGTAKQLSQYQILPTLFLNNAKYF